MLTLGRDVNVDLLINSLNSEGKTATFQSLGCSPSLSPFRGVILKALQPGTMMYIRHPNRINNNLIH